MKFFAQIIIILQALDKWLVQEIPPKSSIGAGPEKFASLLDSGMVNADKIT
jgi:hypothetical protein